MIESRLEAYSYPYEYRAAGPSRVTVEDGIHQCVHCESASSSEIYTYLYNCRSINCEAHTKTERLEGTPVCTGCAVTDQFAFATKYFYDKENLEAFRREYEGMPLHEKAMENPPLVAGTLLTTLLAIVGVLVAGGVI